MSSYLPSWERSFLTLHFPPFWARRTINQLLHRTEANIIVHTVQRGCYTGVLAEHSLQVCSYTDCSLSWKWLWPMLSKISPAPLAARSLPRTWMLRSKFQISLTLLSPGKFFWPLGKVLNTKKTLLIPSMELLFFLYTYFGEEIRIWLKEWERRERQQSCVGQCTPTSLQKVNFKGCTSSQFGPPKGSSTVWIWQ